MNEVKFLAVRYPGRPDKFQYLTLADLKAKDARQLSGKYLYLADENYNRVSQDRLKAMSGPDVFYRVVTPADGYTYNRLLDAIRQFARLVEAGEPAAAFYYAGGRYFKFMDSLGENPFWFGSRGKYINIHEAVNDPVMHNANGQMIWGYKPVSSDVQTILITDRSYQVLSSGPSVPSAILALTADIHFSNNDILVIRAIVNNNVKTIGAIDTENLYQISQLFSANLTPARRN